MIVKILQASRTWRRSVYGLMILKHMRNLARDWTISKNATTRRGCFLL